jgi:hypothetical protein
VRATFNLFLIKNSKKAGPDIAPVGQDLGQAFPD